MTDKKDCGVGPRQRKLTTPPEAFRDERAADARFVREHGTEALREALETDRDGFSLAAGEFERRIEWLDSLTSSSHVEAAPVAPVVSLDSYRKARDAREERTLALKARAQSLLSDPYGGLLEDLYQTLAHAARVIERERSKPRDAS